MLQPIRLATSMKLLVVLCSIALLACEGDQPAPLQGPLEIQTRTFLSKPFVVDQIYRSMKGPTDRGEIQIDAEGPPERIWIVSYETEIVDPTTGAVVSEEFMCHNNLNFEDVRDHRRLPGWQRSAQITKRLFTLSQGMMSIRFPDGFGVPIMSSEKFQLLTQILNLNPVDQTRQVQYKTTVRYAREEDAKGRLRPLYQKAVQGLKLLSGPDGLFGAEHGDTEGRGESCSIGELAGKRTIKDKKGRSFAAHWVVESGVEENHTYATEMLGLKQDTTIHYIAVHLHPFADSLELRDLTTGESVFKSKATNSTGRIGLDHVEYYSSEEGIPLYKDHEYTLISLYDNTSGEPQDAMAVMFLYMVDGNLEERLLTN